MSMLSISLASVIFVATANSNEISAQDRKGIISTKARIDRAFEKSDFAQLKKMLSEDYFVQAKGLPTLRYWTSNPQNDPHIQNRDYQSTYTEFIALRDGIVSNGVLRQKYTESKIRGGRTYSGTFRVKEFWKKKHGTWWLCWTKYETKPLFKIVK